MKPTLMQTPEKPVPAPECPGAPKKLKRNRPHEVSNFAVKRRLLAVPFPEFPALENHPNR